MRPILALALALAILASSASASSAPRAQRIADGAAANTDPCEPLTQDVCGKTPGCVWCRCAAVPSACYQSEQAKRLPPAVFQVLRLAELQDGAKRGRPLALGGRAGQALGAEGHAAGAGGGLGPLRRRRQRRRVAKWRISCVVPRCGRGSSVPYVWALRTAVPARSATQATRTGVLLSCTPSELHPY
ncbi:MAG: hypothetical protein J3K34DRAFT_55294 [Monoraphidium minutum]|nr:MAG: hypothetical protein J3K34DRAFT_55294 [Monoraphidium minutum]